MSSKTFALQALAAACLAIGAGSSHAALTVVTSLASFTSGTTATGTDGFTGLSITGSTPSPLLRATQTGTAYNYSATAETTSFFGAGTTANPWLSTNTATDSVLFSGFAGSIRAIGGNFFGSNIAGLFQAGDVTLTAVDSFGATLTQTITGATTTSFLGFFSTGTITTLTLSSVQPLGGGFLWPTVDNLVMGQLAPIPEPGTYALMFAGLAAVGAMVRRRKA